MKRKHVAEQGSGETSRSGSSVKSGGGHRVDSTHSIQTGVPDRNTAGVTQWGTRPLQSESHGWGRVKKNTKRKKKKKTQARGQEKVTKWKSKKKRTPEGS